MTDITTCYKLPNKQSVLDYRKFPQSLNSYERTNILRLKPMLKIHVNKNSVIRDLQKYLQLFKTA